MSADNPPIPPGEWSTDSKLEADLGKEYTLGLNRYRLVKVTSDITTAACKAVCLAGTGTVTRPTWVVVQKGGANIKTDVRRIGLISSVDGTISGGITGSATTTTSTTITASTATPAYGLICTAGPHQFRVLSTTTALAAGSTLNYSSGVSGALLVETGTAAAGLKGLPIGVTLNTGTTISGVANWGNFNFRT